MSEAKTLAQQLVNEIKKRIKDVPTLDLGVVTAVKLQTGTNNVQTYVVDVVLRDTGDITSYTPNPKPQQSGLRFSDVPIMSFYRGLNFGFFVMPKLGQTVVLAFMNKYLEDPIIIGMADAWFDTTPKLFKDCSIPLPANVTFQGGEVLLYHESGTYIKIQNNKGIVIQSGTGKGFITINSNGAVVLGDTLIDKGRLTIDANGNLTLQDNTLVKGRLRVNATDGDLLLRFLDTKSVGSGTIASAQATVTIANTRVLATSKIFLTATNTNATAIWVDNIIAGTSFRVNRASAPANTATFNYLIVDSIA